MKNFSGKIISFCKRNPIATALIALSVVTLIVSIILLATLIPRSNLTKIEIVNLPEKTDYIEGEDVNTDGMVVKAYYGKKSKTVTDYYVDKKQVGINDKEIKVSYSDNGAVKSATYAISVVKKDIVSLEITKSPDKLKYIEHSYFRPDGMEVTAYYNNGKSEVVEGWEYDKKGKLQIDDTLIRVSYGGKSATVAIEIEAKVLQSVYLKKTPVKLSYTEGEYFDFLGVEVYAKYANADDELIKDWEYDKTGTLILSDKYVEFSFTMHGVTKTVGVTITVIEAPDIDEEQKFLQDVLDLLPPIESMNEDNLSSIEYAISLLDGVNQLTPEQIALKESLENKRDEIVNSLPPVEEKVYDVVYKLPEGLEFEDVDFGENPDRYKNSDGAIILKPAVSQSAVDGGYYFNGWLLNGQVVDKLDNISSDVTIFADFKLTPTVKVLFLDYYDNTLLAEQLGIIRTEKYDLLSAGINSAVISAKGEIPIAFYNKDKTRITVADLSKGKEVSVYVVTAKARELHIDGSQGASVSWSYGFEVEGNAEQTSEMPDVGSVFVIPIGASVKIVSMHANIDDILVDGVSKGENLNNTVVQAEFTMTEGEYAVSVTFKTKLSEMATLSFLGYNQHSVVYPPGWDGVISSVDLKTVKFIYDEDNANYLTVYTINGEKHYFDDLASYRFDGDTQIYVSRVSNSFDFTLYYQGGFERIDELVGKQTLQDALSGFSQEALEVLNAILDDGRLYLDAQKTNAVSAEDLLAKIIRSDIVVYSDWERPAEPAPSFDEVDYSGKDFVNTWTALFVKDADVLSSELILSADGLYGYKTFVNGAVSADVSGIYRIENGKVVLKTAQFNQPYQLFQKEDIAIDVEFACDGLTRVNFIDIRDTQMTVFEHTMTCGNVRPVNYTNRDFIGTYELNGAKIELRENGTAVIVYDNQSFTVNYRVDEDGKLIVFDNGDLGTGEVKGIWEVK